MCQILGTQSVFFPVLSLTKNVFCFYSFDMSRQFGEVPSGDQSLAIVIYDLLSSVSCWWFFKHQNFSIKCTICTLCWQIVMILSWLNFWLLLLYVSVSCCVT
jgi:hypothetical protein